MIDFEVSPVTPQDYNAWLTLWHAYCAFYHADVAERVTEQTWRRINEPTVPIYGMLAKRADGDIVGFCHYVCHLNTWSDQTVCYLEDVFVSPAARRLGIATAFIERLKDIGHAQNWRRIYWITNADNLAAQAAYDLVGKRTGHIRYEILLDAPPD